MSLAKCRNCQGKVSTYAKMCPHCGTFEFLKIQHDADVDHWGSIVQRLGLSTVREGSTRPGPITLTRRNAEAEDVVMELTLTEIENLRENAADGSIEANAKLGAFYCDRGDYREAFDFVIAAAKSGHAESMYRAGLMFMGIAEKNPKHEETYKAFFGAAAENGHVASMVYCATSLREEDPGKAFQYAVQAAVTGDVEGVYILGHLYLAGIGTTLDQDRAYQLFRYAAERGKPEACYFVSMAFRSGFGVSRSVDDAVAWMMQAYRLGDEDAPQELEEYAKEYPEHAEAIRRILATPK